MYMIRTLSGNSLQEQMNPPLRKINYDNYPQGVLVTQELRRAFVTQPTIPAAEQADAAKLKAAFEDVIKSTANQSDEEWRASLAGPITKSHEVHTPWRDLVYHNFNHVFADAWRFLAEAAGDVGVFNPPCEEALPLYYPARQSECIEKTFEHNVFILPVFAHDGVRIRIETEDEAQSGVFDLTKNPFEIWWIKGGKPVKIFIDGFFGMGLGGLAAIMVLGVLPSAGPFDPVQMC